MSTHSCRKHIIFQKIYFFCRKPGQRRAEITKNTLIRKILLYDLKHRPDKLRKRMKQDVFLIIHKHRYPVLRKDLRRIVSIGRVIPGYDREILVAVVFFPHQTSDLSRRKTQFLPCVMQCENADGILLFLIGCLFSAEQILFQMIKRRRIFVALTFSAAQNDRLFDTDTGFPCDLHQASYHLAAHVKQILHLRFRVKILPLIHGDCHKDIFDQWK